MNERISFAHRDSDQDLDLPGHIKDRRTQESKEDKWRKAPCGISKICEYNCPDESVRKLNGRFYCKTHFMHHVRP